MKLHHQAQLEDANPNPPLPACFWGHQPRSSTTRPSLKTPTKNLGSYHSRSPTTRPNHAAPPPIGVHQTQPRRRKPSLGRLKLHKPLPKALQHGQEAPRPPHHHVVVAKATQPSMPMERRCSTGEGTLPHVLNLLNQMGFPRVDVHQLQALAEIYPPLARKKSGLETSPLPPHNCMKSPKCGFSAQKAASGLYLLLLLFLP